MAGGGRSRAGRERGYAAGVDDLHHGGQPGREHPALRGRRREGARPGAADCRHGAFLRHRGPGWGCRGVVSGASGESPGWTPVVFCRVDGAAFRARALGDSPSPDRAWPDARRGGAGLPRVVYALVRGGYLAVTTFFVLSGFVLSRSYRRTEWSARNLLGYGAGRLARVYPVYLLSLAVVAPFILADRTPARFPLVAAHGLLLQGWLGPVPVNWNTPAWSFSCEIFFYLSFPLAAILVLRAGWRQTAAVALAACCLTRFSGPAGCPAGSSPSSTSPIS